MKPQRTEAPHLELRLPDLDPAATPGSRITMRLVTCTLFAILLASLAAVVVGAGIQFRVTIKGTGMLEPAKVWPVRTREAGFVDRVLPAAGARVAEGEILVRLDTLPQSQLLQQLLIQQAGMVAEAEMARAAAPVEREVEAQALADATWRILRARASLRMKLTEFGVSEPLESWLQSYRPGGHVALDLAVAELRNVEAQRAAQQARLHLRDLDHFNLQKRRSELERIGAQIAAARATLDRLIIRAPAAGVVLTDRPELLEGAPVREGDVLLEIAELENWYASVFVSQQDVHRIRVGDRVLIRLPALRWEGTDEIEGWVVSVAQDRSRGFEDGRSDVRVNRDGLYRVAVGLDDRDVALLGAERLRRGYTVEASIVTRSTNGLQFLWTRLGKRGGP